MSEASGSMGDRSGADNYLRAVIDSLEDESMVIDRDFRIMEVNEAVLARHGKLREGVVGRHCYEISHGFLEPCCSPLHECPVRAAWDTGRPAQAVHVHLHHVGGEKQERHVHVAASPIMDDRVNAQVAACLMRDVTATMELELRITKAETTLRFKKSSIEVHLRDSGKGSDVEKAISSRDGQRGLGLVGMKERVGLLNGTLHIESSPGSGTRIDIRILVNQEAADG